MPHIRPFRAFVPNPALVETLVGPPYDVITSDEARKLSNGIPHSILRITRAEVDLPQSIDEHSDAVYLQARKNLGEFLSKGFLIDTKLPVLMIYRQIAPSHTQTGVVACVSTEDYENGDIRKHELTRPDKEKDRIDHIRILETHDEPVFLAHRSNESIQAAVSTVTQKNPDYDFKTKDEIRHQFWVIREAAICNQIQHAFSKVNRFYIADGHHRSAAAAAIARTNGRQSPESAWFPAVIFPHNQLRILPYHRMVKLRAPHTLNQFLEKLSTQVEILGPSKSFSTQPHEFHFYCNKTWQHARFKANLSNTVRNAKDPTLTLDVRLLQDQVLEPILGIVDPRTDPNLSFLGGIHGPEELARRTDQNADIAFFLHPTSMDELFEVSDQNHIMPPKSTWFEPKLLSGLFLHPHV